MQAEFRALGYPHVLNHQVKMLVSAGHSERFVREFFGITAPDWTEIKKRSPVLRRGLKNWKLQATKQVERAFYKRCTGYTRTIPRRGPDGAALTDEHGNPIIDEEYYPPNVTAGKFWLATQAGWVEPKNVNVSGGMQVSGDVTARIDATEIEDRIKALVEESMGDALQ